MYLRYDFHSTCTNPIKWKRLVKCVLIGYLPQILACAVVQFGVHDSVIPIKLSNHQPIQQLVSVRLDGIKHIKLLFPIPISDKMKPKIKTIKYVTE